MVWHGVAVCSNGVVGVRGCKYMCAIERVGRVGIRGGFQHMFGKAPMV